MHNPIDRAKLYENIGALAHLDGDTRVLRLQEIQTLAKAYCCSMREIEIAALEKGVIPWRYIRNIGTVGLEGQIALLHATVAIVGLGGLGGYVIEALARAGVGRLIVIDSDVFEEHNLNRQLLSLENNAGLKVEAARTRIAQVNSAVEVIGHTARLTPDNLPQLLAGAQVVVDALDRLPSRLDLQKGVQALGIPLVHGSIAGFLGQVMTIFPGDPGLYGLYGEANALPEQGLEAQVGTPPATPMAVAAWQAQEVIKILTGTGTPLRNRLLVMDMATGAVDFLELGEASENT